MNQDGSSSLAPVYLQQCRIHERPSGTTPDSCYERQDDSKSCRPGREKYAILRVCGFRNACKLPRPLAFVSPCCSPNNPTRLTRQVTGMGKHTPASQPPSGISLCRPFGSNGINQLPLQIPPSWGGKGGNITKLRTISRSPSANHYGAAASF